MANLIPLPSPIEYFAALGDLHDARITGLSWDQVEGILCICVDDLHSNFADTPDHSGDRPATLVFGEVSAVALDFPDLETGLRIFELSIQKDGLYAVVIRLAPFRIITFCCSVVGMRR